MNIAAMRHGVAGEWGNRGVISSRLEQIRCLTAVWRYAAKHAPLAVDANDRGQQSVGCRQRVVDRWIVKVVSGTEGSRQQLDSHRDALRYARCGRRFVGTPRTLDFRKDTGNARFAVADFADYRLEVRPGTLCRRSCLRRRRGRRGSGRSGRVHPRPLRPEAAAAVPSWRSGRTDRVHVPSRSCPLPVRLLTQATCAHRRSSGAADDVAAVLSDTLNISKRLKIRERTGTSAHICSRKRVQGRRPASRGHHGRSAPCRGPTDAAGNHAW